MKLKLLIQQPYLENNKEHSPAGPTTPLACYETRSFDATSCAWKQQERLLNQQRRWRSMLWKLEL
jgi:hypothetical protein